MQIYNLENMLYMLRMETLVEVELLLDNVVMSLKGLQGNSSASTNISLAANITNTVQSFTLLLQSLGMNDVANPTVNYQMLFLKIICLCGFWQLVNFF
jgi:hypothetical protein